VSPLERLCGAVAPGSYAAGGFNHLCSGPRDPGGCGVEDFAGGTVYADNRPRVNSDRW